MIFTKLQKRDIKSITKDIWIQNDKEIWFAVDEPSIELAMLLWIVLKCGVFGACFSKGCKNV